MDIRLRSWTRVVELWELLLQELIEDLTSVLKEGEYKNHTETRRAVESLRGAIEVTNSLSSQPWFQKAVKYLESERTS